MKKGKKISCLSERTLKDCVQFRSVAWGKGIRLVAVDIKDANHPALTIAHGDHKFGTG